MIQNIEKLLAANLHHHLHHVVRGSSLYEVYDYATLPAGKLFRPQLVAAAFHSSTDERLTLLELQNPRSSLSLMCSLVEIHHAYTLVHDDLPCMDDDDIRRGRASTHIQFGQWQALLAGDGLHALSYQLLSKINGPQLSVLLKLMSHTLGTKGLIEGQALDCSGEMKKDFKTLRRTHLLKTGRLIQFSILAGHLIAPGPNFKAAKELWRLGETLGIAFQLIDDLSELKDNLSTHEEDINPWLNFQDQSFIEIQKSLKLAINLLSERVPLKNVFANYAVKMLEIITKNQENIQKQLNNDQALVSTVNLLQLLCSSQKTKK